MAVSVSIVNQFPFPCGMKIQVADVTFDSSYPSPGGESLTAAQLGLTKVAFADAGVKAVGGTVDVANVFYDPVNSVIKVYDQTPAEVANAADLSTLVVQVIAYGY